MFLLKGKRVILSVVVLLLPLLTIVGQPDLSAKEIARRALPSVGLLMCDDGKDVYIGSGFFIKPGIFVTNYHVIEGMSRGIVQIASGPQQSKVNFRIARIVAFDKNADLALLSVPGSIGSSIPNLAIVSPSYKIEVGEVVYALGNPEGLVGTISPGIVSAGLRSIQNQARIQITAPISKGSSGGPVVNGNGEVIGITVEFLSDGQNLNFAVPSSSLYSLLRNAAIPDKRQNSLDMAADNSSGLLKPWTGPLAQNSTNRNSDLGERGLATDWFRLGNDSFDAGKDDEAISNYSKSIQLNPNLAIAYARRGLCYNRQRRYDLAIADYTKAIQLDANDAYTYNNRGAAYDLKGDLVLALADFTKALLLESRFAGAYRNRGKVYLRQAKLDRAIADFNKAIELESQNRLGYLLRGNMYIREEKFETALADYEMAIQIDPTYTDAYVMRGVAFHKLSKNQQAIASYTKAIELNPRYAEAYHNRGLVFEQTGKYREANADFSKAIELNPRESPHYLSRAGTYKKLGDYERAIADYSKALEIEPKQSDIYAARAQTWLYANNGASANQDAAKYLELVGVKDELSPYAIIVGYIGLRKAGKKIAASDFLKNWLIQVDSKSWSTQIMRFFTGDLTSAQLLALAVDNDKLTEAHTYIGEIELLGGNKVSARSHFVWVTQNGNKSFTEYQLAVAEFQRLSSE